MSEAKGHQEPSMEEILASIRRIIAEDGDAPQPVEAEAPAAAPVDDILELTEVVEEPPPPAPIFRVIDDEPEPEPDPEPEPIRMAPQPRAWRNNADDEHLVSEETAQASTAAFASLANRVRRQVAGDIMLGNGSITLEEMVRDLLRPLLQDWLDSNLPQLVERLVREEVERLSRDAM